MDWNLILSAQTLRLASELQQGDTINGICVIKNVRAKTYLKVTANQWLVLQRFGPGRTVPAVFDQAIRERICPRLGEFFELILKAAAAKILLEPGAEPLLVPLTFPRVAVRPSWFFWPLLLLFIFGLGLSLGVRPEWPRSVVDLFAGAAALSLALSTGALIAGLLLTGGGGEVGRPRCRWLVLLPFLDLETSDAIMQPLRSQYAIFLARAGTLAAIVGLTVWHESAWCFLPLLGLVIYLRPILGGQLSSLIQIACGRQLSDAEHSFLFPPNWRTGERWRSLKRSLRERRSWIVVLYGAIWMLAVIFIAARLMDSPPWAMAFWQHSGLQILVGTGIALLVVALGYLGWEFFHFARERARAQRETIRQWKSRWFGARKLVVQENTKLQVMVQSPLLGTLALAERKRLAPLLQEIRVGYWKSLPPQFGPKPTHLAVIASGKIRLRRVLPNGRKLSVQVLTEGDVIGLHDLAEPGRIAYTMVTVTPVVLLAVERAAVQEILARIGRALLTDAVLKVPFLRRIPLCQNWHVQAVERFAQLSKLVDYAEGDVIFSEGQSVRDFSIIFQGDAEVIRATKKPALVRAGEFFGEVELLQNSISNVTVVARRHTRCLRIERSDFMRFVTHNHMVALELERVSSARLGRPILPHPRAAFPEPFGEGGG